MGAVARLRAAPDNQIQNTKTSLFSPTSEVWLCPLRHPGADGDSMSMTAKRGTRLYAVGNLEVAGLILAAEAKYGGETAGLVAWERMVLARAEASPLDAEAGPLFRVPDVHSGNGSMKAGDSR